MSINVIISKLAYKEIRIRAIRREEKESVVAGEIINLMLENLEEKEDLKLADVYALQKRVEELELLVMRLTSLPPISKALQELTPQEDNTY